MEEQKKTPLFKPIHNNVVVLQKDISEMKQGSIIISDIGKEKPREGKVLATGPGMVTINGIVIPCQVKVGDNVVFPSFGGVTMQIENEDYVVLKDTDILTIIK